MISDRTSSRDDLRDLLRDRIDRRSDLRDLILERTKAGLEAAKKRGKRLGPPLKWSPEMAKKARALMTKDGLNADDAARVLGVSRRTMFRGLKAARDHDELVRLP